MTAALQVRGAGEADDARDWYATLLADSFGPWAG